MDNFEKVYMQSIQLANKNGGLNEGLASNIIKAGLKVAAKTGKKIAEKTVSKMITYYQCKPEEILCFICPSIRKCHFEVDEDVKILCENIFGFTNKLNDFIKKGDIKENKQKYFIDTVLINKILLKEMGLKEKNIIDCNLCSVCNSDKIASYRVEGKEFRRATAIISL